MHNITTCINSLKRHSLQIRRSNRTTDNECRPVICEPQKRASNAKQTRACLKKRAFSSAKANAPLLCYSHSTIASKLYCAVVVNGEVEFEWRRRVWMILDEKKHPKRKVHDSSRDLYRVSTRCVYRWWQLCRMVLNLEAVCALLKTDPVRTAIFSKPWPQLSCWKRTHSMRHARRCHAPRNAFPGTKRIFAKTRKENSKRNRKHRQTLVPDGKFLHELLDLKKEKNCGFQQKSNNVGNVSPVLARVGDVLIEFIISWIYWLRSKFIKVITYPTVCPTCLLSYESLFKFRKSVRDSPLP